MNDFFVLDTDPPPHAIVTEPTCLQLVERRLRHFTNESKFSDVTFLVEGKRVYGHRLILSTVSDCFRAMFTTGFKESTQRGCAEIEIPNCSYHTFLSMMEYMYTGNLMPMDVSTPQGIEHAVEMLELADLFILEHLKQECEKILQPVVNLDTLDYLTQVAQKTNSPQLCAICSHFQRNIENNNH
uniref:BTB domain-containing protein n=1 Tax=Eucampia antarctica TaxID=49252 RepID=A0A6U0SL89_9STRA